MASLFGNTQGLSTQSSAATTTPKFINWCKAFVNEYTKRFDNPEGAPSTQTEESAEKFRENFNKFVNPNLAENGKRYKSMFRHLISNSFLDKGDLCYSFLKALIDLMKRFEVDELHRYYVLVNFLKIFEVDELNAGTACDLEILYKDEISKMSTQMIRDIHIATSLLFKDEEISKKRSVKLFVWLATLRDPSMTNRVVFEKLLDTCSYIAINGVVGVICDDDQIAVFHAYAERFLKNGFLQDTSAQKLGFAKITACLRNFTDPEIHDIIYAFCEAWAKKDGSFFLQIADEIVEFMKVLHRHPFVGKAVLKVFKKHKKYVRSSVFGLMCQIGLISSYRYSAEVSKMLSLSLSRIWQFADNLESDGWIYTVINDLKLREIKAKFYVIVDLIKNCEIAADVLSRGLVILSIQLIESSSKKASFNIIEGKLEHIENDISFIGRRLLVDTILSVTIEADKKYTLEPLESLVNAICSNASKIPTVYFFIDVLVELRDKNPSMLVMNWNVFDKLARHICDLPSEVAVKVMSALMPVIIRRSGLRKEIFDAVKVQMFSMSKVSIALPVMFQLLRSLIEQPETKAAFQCSQSFASFSSQINRATQKASSSVMDTIPIIECIKRCMRQSPATQCLVYKGIVDICKKNNYFVIHGLDLLLGELTALPELNVKIYMEKSPGGIDFVKYQCPQLLKATATILTAATISLQNNTHTGPSQLADCGAEIIDKAQEEIIDYIDSVTNVHLEDLEMDKSNVNLTKPNTSKTAYYKAFGYMLVKLYDVIIEYFWDFKDANGATEEKLRKIGTFISRRKTLHELLETKPKKQSDSNTKSQSKSKNAKKSSAKDETLQSSKYVGQDLQINVPKLSLMLESIELPMLEDLKSNDGTATLKDVFLSWLISRIHDSVSLLDPKSSTCLASSKSLTSMASSLLKFWSSKEPNLATEAMKAYVGVQTKAVESYSKILIYILTKYEARCAGPLKDIFENVISANFEDVDNYPEYTQIGREVSEVAQHEVNMAEGDNINATGFDKNFRIYSSKHIAAYYQKIVPGIFWSRDTFEARKTLPEYHKQICAFISVARKLCQMLTSSSNEIRTNVYKLIIEVAEKHAIEDKGATVDFWKAVFEIIAHSKCDDVWIKTLNEHVKYLMFITTGNKVDKVPYKSLNTEIAPQLFVIVTRTMSSLLAKVRTAVNVKLEIGDEITDDFLVTICCIVEEFAGITLRIIKIDNEMVTKNEQVVTGVVEMLTDFYITMNCITQQFRSKCNSKVDMRDWDSLNAFDRLIGEVTNDIVKESEQKFGSGQYAKLPVKSPKPPAKQSSKTSKTTNAKQPDDPQKAAKEAAKKQQLELMRRNKKDEKLFVRLDREFEVFYGTLLMVEEALKSDDRPFTLPAAQEKAMRFVAVDEVAYAHALGGGNAQRDESEEEDNESDEDNNKSEKDDEESESGDSSSNTTESDED